MARVVNQNQNHRYDQSETEWVIESLGEIPWVPRIDGEFEKFENCILPTIEMKESSGKIILVLKTKCDCDSSTVKARSKDWELSVMIKMQDSIKR